MRKSYFPVATFFLLLFTIGAFWDNLYSNVSQPSNSDPKFIVHGLLCGAWMILLFAQTNFVRAGNIQLHRRLGLAGAVIALGVTLSTIWVFFVVWKGWAAMSPEVKANRLLLPSYSVFVALAFINRRRTDVHKRLMYTGTLFMLDPVLARCYDPYIVPLMKGWTVPQIDDAFLPVFFSGWLAFFLSLFAYDAFTLKRVHPVTWVALVWFVVAWLIAFQS